LIESHTFYKCSFFAVQGIELRLLLMQGYTCSKKGEARKETDRLKTKRQGKGMAKQSDKT
jgi:hypothetical protein